MEGNKWSNEYDYKKDFICVLLFNLLGSVNCHITMHSYGKKSPVDDTPGIGQAATKEIIWTSATTQYVSLIFLKILIKMAMTISSRWQVFSGINLITICIK